MEPKCNLSLILVNNLHTKLLSHSNLFDHVLHYQAMSFTVTEKYYLIHKVKIRRANANPNFSWKQNATSH